MNTYFKENDMLVSTLLNPTANVNDLIHSGINENNTQFLSPQEYKDSEFIKKQFSDEEGKFNEELFNAAYQKAAATYMDLTDRKVADKLTDFIRYNPKDIYAPANAKYQTPTYEILRVLNPYESLTGIRSLFGTEESNKSIRELAQKNKIFDTETGEWLDKSAEDLGFIGGLLSKPLVYAQWDEDGTHEDPVSGRVVSHKKGDYKLNELGLFYTETIGKRQAYDKQFVALSDILTKEDSWLNKIDVLDSDDRDKSAIGTVMKAALKIAPYMIPYFNVAWGGLTAAINLGQVMPTFAKALEGLVHDDHDTEFAKQMSLFENYFKRFDNSISDAGQQKQFGIEQIGLTVSDIFGLLYQMRAIGAISRLKALQYNKEYLKSFNNFLQKHQAELASLINSGKLKPTEESLRKFWATIADQTPELKALFESQSKLSKQLSMGYMGLITSADVYKEALDGGYSRDAAGFATLAAFAGQYWAMMKLDDNISAWFLDSVVGFNENAARLATRNTVKPLMERMQGIVEKLPGMAPAERQKSFASIVNDFQHGLKNAYYKIMDGSSEFLSRSLAESIEEITEEAMMDATKGTMEALTKLGFFGSKNNNASFDTFENLFSREGLIRYAQNALGGFLGGGLFHLQNTYIEPLLRGKNPVDEMTEMDLIRGIQRGEAEAYKQVARELGKRDNYVAASPVTVGDSTTALTATEGQETRGQMVSRKVIEHIEFLQGLLNQYDANLSEDELVSKAIRDQQLIPLLQESNILNLIIDDFDSVVVKLAKLKPELDALQEKEKRTSDEEATLKKLKSEERELSKQIEDFLSGENTEYYLKVALAYLNPNIRENLGVATLYEYAKTTTGRNWEDLPDSGSTVSKESVKNAYEEFVKKTDAKEQIKVLVNVMTQLEELFSPVYKIYADSKYTDVRQVMFDKVLSDANLKLAENIKSTDYYNTLLHLSESASQSGKLGVTLNDIILVSPELIKNTITTTIYNYARNNEIFDAIALIGGVTTDQLMDRVSSVLANLISSTPIAQWDTKRIDSLMLELFDKIELSAGDNLDIKLLLSSYRTPDTINENVARTVFQTYIQSQEIVDNEAIIYMKEMAKRSLSTATLNKLFVTINDSLAIENEYDELEYLVLSTAAKTNIKSIINTGIDLGTPQEDLVKLIVNEVINDAHRDESPVILTMFETDPSLIQTAADVITDFINKAPDFEDFRYLQTIVGKPVSKNALYDLLRNLSLQLSPNTNTTIFNLLQQESTTLSGLYDISEYVKMPDLKEQIKNAISILKIAKAIVIGMEGSELDGGEHLFGFNNQLKRYLTEFKLGENAERYQVIDTKDVISISTDLDILLNKLEFLDNLSNLNTASKSQEDANTRELFCTKIAEYLSNNASKLKVNGVSILTDDDVAKLKDSSVAIQIRIGKVQQTLYTKFKEILNSGVTVEEAINQIFNNINLNVRSICDSSLASFGLSDKIESVSEYDYATWLVTALSNPASNFRYYYKEILKASKSEQTPKTPLFTLEYNAMVNYAFISDKLGVHAAAAKYIVEKGGFGKYPVLTTNISFIDGVSGSGKTTSVAKRIVQFLSKDTLYFVAAPNKKLVENLVSALELSADPSKLFNKEDLLKYFLPEETYNKLQLDSLKTTFTPGDLVLKKPSTNDPNGATFMGLADDVNDSILKTGLTPPPIIFIDEATHFNTAEWQILDIAAEKYGFKIVALGDTYQESANIGKSEAHIDQVFVWKGPRLNISIRPTNVNKKENIDRFQTVLDSWYNNFRITHSIVAADDILKQNLANNGLVIKYYEDPKSLDGDKFVDHISVDDLNNLKKKASGKPIGIIVDLDGSGEIKNAAFKATLDSSDLTPGDYVLYSPEKMHAKAVQGSETEYFAIVDSGIVDGNTKPEIIKKLYTLLTRSERGSLIQMPSGVKDLHILNTITSKPGAYKIPGSEQSKDIIDKRILDIEVIIGKNYTPIDEQLAPSNPSNPNPEPAPTAPIVEPEAPKVPDPNPAAPIVPPTLPTPIVTSDVPQQPTEPVPYTTVQVSAPDTIEFGTEQLTPEDNLSIDLTENLLCYTFYNHLGVESIGSGQYKPSGKAIPVNLSNLNISFSYSAILGYIKLKNLITLSKGKPNDFILSGLRYSKFTEDIAQFYKELSGEQYLDSESCLQQLASKLKIEKGEYVVGISMDPKFDSPLFKLGFVNSLMVAPGFPLLMPAKKVTIEGTAFSNFMTMGALAKSDTLISLRNPKVHNLGVLLQTLESNFLKELTSKSYVVKECSEEFKLLGKAEGRVVRRKANENPFFNPLTKVVASGAYIKDAFLVTDAQDENRKYKFIEWAKKFNPRIEDIALKNGKFNISGKYAARVGFTSASKDGTDHVLILDLALVDVAQSLRELKSIQGDIAAKLQILHANSYNDIVARILNSLGLFNFGQEDNLIKVLKDFLNTLNKNSAIHFDRIKILTNFINNSTNFSLDEVLKMLAKDSAISMLFADYLIKEVHPGGDVVLHNDRGIVSRRAFENLIVYTNMSPIDIPDSRGVCKIDNIYDNLHKLGLRNIHYEPSLMAMNYKVIQDMNQSFEATTPLPEPPKSPDKTLVPEKDPYMALPIDNDYDRVAQALLESVGIDLNLGIAPPLALSPDYDQFKQGLLESFGIDLDWGIPPELELKLQFIFEMQESTGVLLNADNTSLDLYNNITIDEAVLNEMSQKNPDLVDKFRNQEYTC